MNYLDNYHILQKAMKDITDDISVLGLDIHKKHFHSKYSKYLSGNKVYKCDLHQQEFIESDFLYNDIGAISEDVHINDSDVKENIDFPYYIIKPKSVEIATKTIFLFHGFNEKSWDKYLTWAAYISENTGSAVVLFPIAFHMQRAPVKWSDRRDMFNLSEKRKKRFPNIVNSSLSNVAISMRLHAMPQRFIWSGIESYYDIINFVNLCTKGEIDCISKDSSFDFFAYSIGGFLAQILKLSNYKEYFTDSKVCLFCSGAVFNRLTPVSRMIIDSEALVSLYSYLVEHFESFLKKDVFLNHFMNGDHIEGTVFRSMFDYMKMRDYRERLLKDNRDCIYAITLKNDSVIPSVEIINTLKGAYRDIDIRVDELDFEYDYTHENPFPIKKVDASSVELSYNTVFGKVCDFFNK